MVKAGSCMFIDLNRFLRNLTVKKFYATKTHNSPNHQNPNYPTLPMDISLDPADTEMSKILEELLWENESIHPEIFVDHTLLVQHTYCKPKSIFCHIKRTVF